MRGLWVRRYVLDTGRIFEAAIVLERTAPYVKYSSTLRDISISTQTTSVAPLGFTRSIENAWVGIDQAIRTQGAVLDLVDVNVAAFEPEPLRPWIQQAREALRRWEGNGFSANGIHPDASWVDIATALEKLETTPGAVQSAVYLFRQIAARIVDVIVWEFNRKRTSSAASRAGEYPYSLHRISACLDALRLLDPTAKTAPLAEVIDFKTAKQRLRGSSCP